MNRSAREALERLIRGNERFRKDYFEGAGRDRSRRRALAEGQAPSTVILSCSDSRVAPVIAFDAGLGELFVVQVAGNVANQSSIASIEYALANLGSRLVVVMAHEKCGAVEAAIQGGDHGRHLNHLLSHIKPAIQDSDRAEPDRVAMASARFNADRLIEESGVVRQAVEQEGAAIVTAFYRLHTGAVDFDWRAGAGGSS